MLIGIACGTILLQAEESAWQSKAAAGLSLAKGNSDTVSLSLELTADQKTQKHETSLGALFAYGETGAIPTEQNGKAFAHYNMLSGGRTYLYVNFDIGHDSIASVDYRIITGPGIGYYVLKDENQALKVEIGASYVDEKLRNGTGSDTIALRIMQRYELALSKTAKLWTALEYLPELDDMDTFLLNAELGVETTISSKLSLRLLIQNRYDSAPVTGADENDVSARMALVYNMGT
jgi:putative salt-induced outer membrane protein YdiY